MVIRFAVKSDVSKVISTLKNLRQDQLPFAIAKAVTATAQLAKRAVATEILYAFDRPTPYTMNSLFLKPATKSIPVAKVWLKDDAGKGTPAAKYLLPQIEGGGRRYKRFENALIATGKMPSSMYAVPGAGAKIDAYGNMERGQVMKVLSALGSGEMRSGYQANRTATSRKRKGRRLAEYFVAPADGHLAPGVWQRFAFAFGSAIKPVVMFTRAPNYKVRYRFQEIAEQVVREEFPGQFRAAYAVAIATAK